MPDNAQTGSTVVAADELHTLNGVEQSLPLPKAQRVKILHGTDSDGTDTSAEHPLPVAVAHGLFGYAAATGPGTVDVPVGARVRYVTLLASVSAATIAIAGGDTITVPAGGAFDRELAGDTALGADVVIGGSVASYYVEWVT